MSNLILIVAVIMSVNNGFLGLPISESSSKVIFTLPPLQNNDRIRLNGVMKAAPKSLNFTFYPPNSDNNGPDLHSDEFTLDVGKHITYFQNVKNISLEFLLRSDSVQTSTLSSTDIIPALSNFDLSDVKYLGVGGDIDRIVELEFRFKNLKMTEN